MDWLFTSDIHGSVSRFRNLFKMIEEREPPAVLIGGDVLPPTGDVEEFVYNNIFTPIRELKEAGIKASIFLIPGNDDPKSCVSLFREGQKQGLYSYIPMKVVRFGDLEIAGYPYVPPSPFLLKDWELFDVSRYVDPGSISPLEGVRTDDMDVSMLKFRTIKDDLDKLLKKSDDPSRTVYLFHSPPFDTKLDMSYAGETVIDHVRLDPHIGSIAVKRFIEEHQPPVTLHGHVHESFELTGSFYERLGDTLCISGAGSEKDLVLVTFDPSGRRDPEREIII